MDVDPLVRTGMRVSLAPLERDAYRRDLWPRDTLRLARDRTRPPAPDVVVWPCTEAQVAASLAWAHDSGAVVVPYGGGSGVCGGAAGRSHSIVVDTKRFDRIGLVDPDTRTVEVGAGVLGAHLEEALARQGWMTGHSPSSIMCSTVGGYVAARSAGQFSSRYGVFDDILLAAEIVTPSGTKALGEWLTGEDLLPLVSGSEGGLGVVTRALLRVAPIPTRRWLRGYAFGDVQAAEDAMRRIMQADLWPSVLRLYDPIDTRVAGRARGASEGASVLSRLRDLVAPISGALSALPLALPDLTNRLADSLPGECVLIVGFDDDDAAAERAVPMLSGARDLGPGPGERWYAHRHDVSYKLIPIFVQGHFADTMEVASTWANLERLHIAVRDAIGRHAFVMAHLSHAYREGCSIYFSFVGRGKPDVYDAVWRDALDAVRTAGGTVTHHHGAGQLKSDAAAREIGAAFRLWAAAKARLDPAAIMNPGVPFGDREQRGEEPPVLGAGPVFAIDRTSLLASIDPESPATIVDDNLASQGFRLRSRPDRPLGAWLRTLRRRDHGARETPLFSVQASFADGARVRLGHAPRSAAGPDLRWELLRSAAIEMVEVAIEPRS
jgi:alkyldihydroxyacetonephosphate synthase